MFVEIMTIFTQ